MTKCVCMPVTIACVYGTQGGGCTGLVQRSFDVEWRFENWWRSFHIPSESFTGQKCSLICVTWAFLCLIILALVHTFFLEDAILN